MKEASGVHLVTLGLTVTEYPPRGRAGVELRQVARWLTQVLAQPAAHASSS